MRTLCLFVPATLLACNPAPAETGAADSGDDTDTASIDTGDADTDTDSDSDSDTDTDTDTDTYAFSSSSGDGSSSVAYDGQVFRHLLISDMKAHLGGITARIDGGWFPVAGEVAGELEFYFAFDGETSSDVGILYATEPAAAQATYGEVASGKDLVGKIAGNDAPGPHEDWATAFVGWNEAGVTTPESLVRLWIEQIDAAAVARSNGDIPLAPDGTPVGSVHLTADGRDLQQLLQKFLTGAVAFSQGADDYLDDDVEGAGLLSDHAALVDGKPYTALEHAWDEGFGYFGASRDYCTGDDEIIVSPGYADTVSEDGAIDLLTEVCWGHSVNAAKRDAGSVVATDFTADAWEGFLGGRALLAATPQSLDASQLAELQAFRDRAVGAWEEAIAATVVHYINACLGHQLSFDTASYDFAAHAKEWSEMKGFALGLQFNPRSAMADEDFATLHDYLGTGPVLPGASDDEVGAYAGDLLAARALIASAYGFDSANLGGDDGTGGW